MKAGGGGPGGGVGTVDDADSGRDREFEPKAARSAAVRPSSPRLPPLRSGTMLWQHPSNPISKPEAAEMPFVVIAGLPGKVYVPSPPRAGGNKHPCPDCHSCQVCAETRCDLCRSRRDGPASRAGRDPGGDSRRDGSER